MRSIADEPRAAPSDDAEREIVRQARSDPAAFAPLYERYVDAVFGYCYRRTQDREQAADLTQQVFVRALAALPRFADRDGTGSFRSWLFSIAHNLLVDTWRTRRETTTLDPERPLHIADGGTSPEAHALASERQRALLAAIAQLTHGQRAVVELRLAGLTGPEIAEALDMTLPAVKSSQVRAYARLRELLGPFVATDASTSRTNQGPHPYPTERVAGKEPRS